MISPLSVLPLGSGCDPIYIESTSIPTKEKGNRMAGFMDCDGESEFGGTSRIGRSIVDQFQR